MILEEIKMVEDTPDDLVHEIFTEHYWRGHPLGRPILGTPATVEALVREGSSPATSATSYVALEPHRRGRRQPQHDRLPALIARAFGGVGATGPRANGGGPPTAPQRGHPRQGSRAEPHRARRRPAIPQSHDDRFASYILNTVLRRAR